MFTFKKTERLCSKKDITLLYSTGKSKTFFPLKIFWRENTFESPYPVRVMISVPKRLHKKAADRNLIKRRIREAYRLQKQPFYDAVSLSGKRMDIMLLFTSKEIALLPELMKAVQKAILYAADELSTAKNFPNNVKES